MQSNLETSGNLWEFSGRHLGIWHWSHPKWFPKHQKSFKWKIKLCPRQHKSFKSRPEWRPGRPSHDPDRINGFFGEAKRRPKAPPKSCQREGNTRFSCGKLWLLRPDLILVWVSRSLAFLFLYFLKSRGRTMGFQTLAFYYLFPLLVMLSRR